MATRDPNLNPNAPVNRNFDRGRYWGNGLGCGLWLLFFIFCCIIVFGGWGWYGGWWGGPGWGGGWRNPNWNANRPIPSGQITSAQVPTELMNRSITIRGKVGQVMSDHEFTLSAVGGRDLLVIVKKAPPEKPKAGEEIEVTGKLESFDRNRVQQETGVTLNENQVSWYLGRPAVIATAINEHPSKAAE